MGGERTDDGHDGKQLTCFGRSLVCRVLIHTYRSIRRSHGARQGCQCRRPFQGGMKGSSLSGQYYGIDKSRNAGGYRE